MRWPHEKGKKEKFAFCPKEEKKRKEEIFGNFLQLIEKRKKGGKNTNGPTTTEWPLRCCCASAVESLSCAKQRVEENEKKQNIHNVALFPRVSVCVCLWKNPYYPFASSDYVRFFRVCEKKNCHSTKAIGFEEKSKNCISDIVHASSLPPTTLHRVRSSESV